MKKSQRVIAALIALILVFNIGIMNASAFAAEAATAIGIGTVLKWLGITAAGTAVSWGVGEGLNAIFNDEPVSTTGNNYYSNYTSGGNGFGYVNSGAPTYKHIVDINNSKITTYNTTTNNYVTNTVNRITYNQTNNTYYTNYNNTNYFITYRPTYVNVTYVIDGGGIDDAISYNLYYQLPDGRNSYDLTANDVFGQVMLTDFVNYKQVVEDDGKTQLLMHFDGDISNSAATNLYSAYAVGASVTYVDTGAFGKAVYYPVNPTMSLWLGSNDIGTGDFTLEYRVKQGDLVYQNNLVGQDILSTWDYVDWYVNWDHTNAYGTKQAIKTNLMIESDGGRILTDLTHVGRIDLAGNYLPTWYRNRVILDQIQNYQSYRTSERGTDGVNDYTVYYYDNLTASSIVPMSKNLWNHVAIVRRSGTIYYYLNGVLQGTKANTSSISNGTIRIVKWAYSYDMYLDELRLTKQALYTSNFTPSSMPYDTNKVLVLPETGAENRIAIKSSLAINGTRIGGVRPTYPTTGYVYVSLDDDNKVESIQQYNGSDWTNTDGAIYKSGTWENLDEYDFTSFIVTEPEVDETDATPLGNVNVTYILENVTIPDSVNYVVKGGSLAMSVMPDEGYALPEMIAVYMDNELQDAGIDYAYNGGNISIPHVTGDIYISIVADADGSGTTPTHGVSYLLTNLKLASQTRTETSVTATFGISTGYKLPQDITVSVGGNIVQPGTAYSYNNGIVTVPNVSGDVVITASATIDSAVLPSPTPGPSPTPKPGGDDEEDEGLSGFWEFLEGLINFIIDGLGSLISVITNLLENLQGFGQGFVDFLTATLGFIPPEITTMLGLGVGLMIVLAVIKMFKG